MGVNCGYDMVDMNTTFYAEVTEGQENDIFTLHIPVTLPYIAGDECTITQWTVTVFLIDRNGNVYNATPITVNNPTGMTPNIHTETLEVLFNQSGLYWEQLDGLFISFENNCGQTCVFGEWLISFDELPDGGGEGGGEGGRWAKPTLDNTTIEILPNPVDGILTIKREIVDYKMDYSLIDFNGKLLATGILKVNEKSISFDTSDIPSGSYLIRLNSDNGTISKKIVIAH